MDIEAEEVNRGEQPEVSKPLVGYSLLKKHFRLNLGHYFAFRSHHKKYVCAEFFGGVNCNREKAKDWEKFKAVECENDKLAFESHHGKYLGVKENGQVSQLDHHHKFEWEVRRNSDNKTYTIRSEKGQYLSCGENDHLSLVNRDEIGAAEKFTLVHVPAPLVEEYDHLPDHGNHTVKEEHHNEEHHKGGVVGVVGGVVGGVVEGVGGVVDGVVGIGGSTHKEAEFEDGHLKEDKGRHSLDKTKQHQ